MRDRLVELIIKSDILCHTCLEGVKRILQIIVEKITGKTCKRCAYYKGTICSVGIIKNAECVSSIYPKHFKKGGVNNG